MSCHQDTYTQAGIIEGDMESQYTGNLPLTKVRHSKVLSLWN